ncbi:MAG: S41 family peptidase, partial [Planctomycetota bacterium]
DALDPDDVRDEPTEHRERQSQDDEVRGDADEHRASGDAHDADPKPRPDAPAGARAAPATDAPATEEVDRADDDVDHGRPGTLGIDVRLVSGRIVVVRVDPGSPAERAGVQTGWIVSRVAGTDIDSRIELIPDDLEPRTYAMAAWQMTKRRLDGPSGGKVTVEFEDAFDRTVEISMRREPERGVPSRIGNLPTIFCRVNSEPLKTGNGRSVGLLRFNIWLAPIMRPVLEMVDEYRTADGMIVDLRGNPGGIGGLSMGMAGHFVSERETFGTFTVRNNRPLNFVAFPQQISASGERVEPFSGPVALLVDGQTGSTSEIFAGGLQSIGRARVFGETTMGAALPAMMPRLPNGDVLMHAFADFADANGVRLEGRGVVPDEPVTPSREDLLRGADPVLDAALQWIDRVTTESTTGASSSS